MAVLGVSVVAAWMATRLAIPLLQRKGVVDVPNARSSHTLPTPRGGGLGILLGLAVGLLTAWLLGMRVPSPELFLGALLIASVGFMDDRSGGMSVGIRLAIQFVAAGLVVLHTGGLSHLPLPEPLDGSLGWLAVPVALLWIVGVTNFYNFLDGIDGFAGFQGGVVGLGIAFLDQTGLFMGIGLAIAGACAGFLLHNWHPAKIFMGDVGSGTLGFVLAALPFQLDFGYRGQAVFVVAMCLWFFLSDGAFTICRRLWQREKVWEAHRAHLYQRLVRTGLRHDRVVLTVMGAAALLATSAVLAARTGEPGLQWSILALAGAAFVVYCQWTRLREKHFRMSSSPPGR